MKKIILSIGALFAFMLCEAQVKTYSNYDVDGDGTVTISDVTKTVNKLSGKSSEEHVVVDGESVYDAFQQLITLVQNMKGQVAEIKNKKCTCCSDGEEADPYNGHEYVDLGLPSGLKWATCNVGAENPEDYGDYFAWGATAPQDVYDWVHCPYQTQNTEENKETKFTKYLGSTTSEYKDPSATDEDALKTVLDPEDDAAHVNWGGDWRMPTDEEQDELLKNCYWQWVTTYNGKEVNGYIVYKAKKDTDKGKSDISEISANYSVSDTHIFLPAAGERHGSSLIIYDGSYGTYWSSSHSPVNEFYACYLGFHSNKVGCYVLCRYFGRPVRPVCP